MPKIKLKEWADRNNLSYITANRHFHAGLIPNATQLDSGTILVEDDTLEQTTMANTGTNDAMSLFLKKTVEFSKNNSTVEDFAAYVISNFQLKLNGQIDIPRYSKNKPKPEEVQKHFKQFLPDKEKEDQLKAIKNMIKQQAPKVEGEYSVDELSERFTEEPTPFSRTVETNGMDAEYEDMAKFFAETLSSTAPKASAVHMYSPQTTTEGLVTRSVDLNTTPQQINYTGSTSQPFGSSNLVATNSSISGDVGGTFAAPIFISDSVWAAPLGAYLASPAAAASPFQPTQKELLSSAQVIETAETDDAAPRKRGRKPTLRRDR
jgi:hypothetical protein